MTDTVELTKEAVDHVDQLIQRENWHYALAFVPSLVKTVRSLYERIDELETMPLVRTALESQAEAAEYKRALVGARDALRTKNSIRGPHEAIQIIEGALGEVITS